MNHVAEIQTLEILKGEDDAGAFARLPLTVLNSHAYIAVPASMMRLSGYRWPDAIISARTSNRLSRKSP